MPAQAQQQAAFYKQINQLRRRADDFFVEEEEVEQSWQATADKEATTKVQSFILNGVELHFAADKVDGDFCDAASPLSLAGYMNGEFVLT